MSANRTSDIDLVTAETVELQIYQLDGTTSEGFDGAPLCSGFCGAYPSAEDETCAA